MGRPARPTSIEVWMFVKDPPKLRRRRRDKRLTQVQLAALIGTTQQYVSALETGTDRDCSEQVADKISKWLDVDREDYFDARKLFATPTITTPTRPSGSDL